MLDGKPEEVLNVVGKVSVEGGQPRLSLGVLIRLMITDDGLDLPARSFGLFMYLRTSYVNLFPAMLIAT